MGKLQRLTSERKTATIRHVLVLILLTGLLFGLNPPNIFGDKPEGEDVPEGQVPNKQKDAKLKHQKDAIGENNKLDSKDLQDAPGYLVEYKGMEFLFGPEFTNVGSRSFKAFESDNYVDIIEDPSSPQGFIYKQPPQASIIQFGRSIMRTSANHAGSFQLIGEGLYESGVGKGKSNPHWSAEMDQGGVDIDIEGSNGRPISEDKEMRIGGFVPLNNDDDDYNNTSRQGVSFDLTDSPGTKGENDLMKIIIRPYEEAEKFRLRAVGNENPKKIKLWKNKNRTQHVNLPSKGMAPDQKEVFWAV